MILAVASGKGGTGKTTVAVNLAVSLSRSGHTVDLLDCDVEAPNVHAFLKGEPVATQGVTVPVPAVNQEQCDGCGRCGEVCQFGAIAYVGKQVVFFPELCHSCAACITACDPGALLEVQEEIGEVQEARLGDLRLVHGRLDVGRPRAEPVISAVRARARPNATVLIDAPPGAACAAVATVRGADFVLLVTEPTPFGLHDLKQAVGLVRKFALPFGVLINRSTVGDRGVSDYCDAERIPVLLELPDDRHVAEAYARGKLIIDAVPGYAAWFRSLWDHIQDHLPADSGAAR
jgi:MinD superfamily P-loop ATPase